MHRIAALVCATFCKFGTPSGTIEAATRYLEFLNDEPRGSERAAFKGGEHVPFTGNPPSRVLP